MFCPKCGETYDDDSIYCNTCGRALSNDSQSSAIVYVKETIKTPQYRIGIIATIVSIVSLFFWFLYESAPDRIGLILIVPFCFVALLFSTNITICSISNNLDKNSIDTKLDMLRGFTIAILVVSILLFTFTLLLSIDIILHPTEIDKNDFLINPEHPLLSLFSSCLDLVMSFFSLIFSFLTFLFTVILLLAIAFNISAMATIKAIKQIILCNLSSCKLPKSITTYLFIFAFFYVISALFLFSLNWLLSLAILSAGIANIAFGISYLYFYTKIETELIIIKIEEKL